MIGEVRKVESKILALKKLLEKAKRPDEYDPYDDEGDDDLAGLSIRDQDEMEGDAADEWLKANDPDAVEKPVEKPEQKQEAPVEQQSDTATTSKPKASGKAPSDDIKEIAKHWLKRAEQHRAQTASAKKNPVLHAEGHRQVAHNAAHADYNKAYAELKNSDEYKGMSKGQQRRAERDFKRDWYQKNPEHISAASAAVGEAHKKYDEAKRVHKQEQDQQEAHILRGGELGGEKMSDEAAAQSVGGSTADEDRPSGIGQTTEAAFANANRDFIESKRKEKKNIPTGDEDVEDLANPDKNLFDHPVLNKPESKKALNDFMKEHRGLMQGNVNRFMSNAKAKGIADKIDEGDLHYHAMHGLMAAARDYDPDLGHKFSTYASSKMQGLMNTHASSQHPVPRKLREEAKRYMRNQNIQPVKTKTEYESAKAAPQSVSPVEKPEVTAQTQAQPKVPHIDDVKMSDKMRDKLNHIKVIKRRGETD